MSDERQSSGFKRLGETGVRGLGLSGGRARALAIEAAWRRALVQILPEIQARLKRDHPALAIEHLRMMDD